MPWNLLKKPRKFIQLSTACPSHLPTSWILTPKRESVSIMSKVQPMDTSRGCLKWAPEEHLGSCAFPGHSGFLSLCTIDSRGQMILCGRGGPVHCGMFSSMLSLYPLDAGSTLLHQCDNGTCLQTLLNVPWGPKWLRLRTTAPAS